METLKPLFIEEQIEHFLNGTPPEQQKQIAAKIKFVKDNVSRIEIINGKKVYEPLKRYKNIHNLPIFYPMKIHCKIL